MRLFEDEGTKLMAFYILECPFLYLRIIVSAVTSTGKSKKKTFIHSAQFRCRTTLHSTMCYSTFQTRSC